MFVSESKVYSFIITRAIICFLLRQLFFLYKNRSIQNIEINRQRDIHTLIDIHNFFDRKITNHLITWSILELWLQFELSKMCSIWHELTDNTATKSDIQTFLDNHQRLHQILYRTYLYLVTAIGFFHNVHLRKTMQIPFRTFQAKTSQLKLSSYCSNPLNCWRENQNYTKLILNYHAHAVVNFSKDAHAKLID